MNVRQTRRVPMLLPTGQLLTSVLLLLLQVSLNPQRWRRKGAQRTGTGFIMRAVWRMYMGAVWRMNIIRVGCMALTLVALNMVFGSGRWKSGEWANASVVGREGRVRSNVTRRLRMGAGAPKTPSR